MSEWSENMEQDRIPKPGMIYRHFKNKLYQVLAVATHSETGEKMVVYQRLYDDYSVYVRPYDMFVSEVDHEKYPEVTQKYRFEVWNPDTANVDFVPQNIETVKSVVSQKEEKPEPVMPDEEELEGCNPDLLAFLEADTYEEKRDILVNIRKRIDDRLINDIAASLDVTVDDGDLDMRYRSLMNCLDTMTKFECNRFR
ncbi:DUF1653 domain-containing protein [Lachnospiraceae bacterium HCP1S3_C3]